MGHAMKPGLLRHTHVAGAGQGTPAPNEGFALTLAERALHGRVFAHEHDRHDVVVGIGLVAAKRASLARRGPVPSDITTAMEVCGLAPEGQLDAVHTSSFAGLAHSYVAQRRFVDAINDDRLL
jgi:hypothetical protein